MAQIFTRLGWKHLTPQAAAQRWDQFQLACERIEMDLQVRRCFPNFFTWRLSWRQARDQLRSASSHDPELEVERDAMGVEIAKHRNDEGPPELRQHTAIGKSEVNEGGEVRKRARTIDLPRTMRTNNLITFDQESAWRRFAADFHTAILDPRRAPDIGRVPGLGGRNDMREAVEDAKDRIAAAVRSLGGHGTLSADAAWFVMGVGNSVKEWSQSRRIGTGKHLQPQVARGLVMASAATLCLHYADMDMVNAHLDRTATV